MKVYIVMSSYCLEPWRIEKVFIDKDKADLYIIELEGEDKKHSCYFYDYKIVTQEVL